MSKLAAAPVALGLLLSSAAPALAVADEKPTEAATPWLEKVVEKARKLAERKRAPGSDEDKKWQQEIKAVVDELLDWDELTRRSLGRNYKKLSDDQRSEFGKLLREMIEASYRSKLKLAAKGEVEVKEADKVQIKWLDEKLKKTRSTATARVKHDKTVAVIEFKCNWHGKKEGWRVYDVSIDDVSTVRTYRSQFGKIIAKEGFDALMSRMRRKVEDIRAGRADVGPSD